jgi:protein-tyrosine-phosphatase
MASAIFKSILEEAGESLDWRVESAGTWALEGAPVATGSQLALKGRGIDIGNHRSRSITREMIESFDLILTMERSHKEALRAEFPEVAVRVYMLAEMAGYSHDIRDPIGGPLEKFEETATEISRLLIQGFKKIGELAGKVPPPPAKD